MHNVVCHPLRKRQAAPHNVNAWQPSGSALRLRSPAHEAGRRPCDQRRRSPPALPSRDGADRAALGRAGRRSGAPPDQKAGEENPITQRARKPLLPNHLRPASHRRLTPSAPTLQLRDRYNSAEIALGGEGALRKRVDAASCRVRRRTKATGRRFYNERPCSALNILESFRSEAPKAPRKRSTSPDRPRS